MIRPGEPNAYAAEILFYLPKANDPSQPKTGHVFVLGEVQIKLDPGDPWADVELDRLLERGHGWYAIRLTAEQRAAAREVAYQAVCAGAQPDRGTEILGELSGDIPQDGEGILPFYLANVDDPVHGAPVEGHVFVVGEVKLSLPDDAFGNADLAKIVEFGGGLYGVKLDSTQTAKRGKAIVAVVIDGIQRFSGYRTILGEGQVSPPAPPPLPPVDLDVDDDGEAAAAGDLALAWSDSTGDADAVVIQSANDPDLAADLGLRTAVILSLFCDRRAEPDDVPPSGDPNDRRGWWADEFAEVDGDRIGSRLWLLARAKPTNETALRAKEYVREALAWMVEDRVAASVDAFAEFTPRGALLFGADIQRPGRDPVSFRFAHTWNHLQEVA